MGSTNFKIIAVDEYCLYSDIINYIRSVCNGYIIDLTYISPEELQRDLYDIISDGSIAIVNTNEQTLSMLAKMNERYAIIYKACNERVSYLRGIKATHIEIVDKPPVFGYRGDLGLIY